MAFEQLEASAQATRLRRRGHALTGALAGWVLGTALQLQQAALWPAGAYAAMGGAALALLAGLRWGPRGTVPGAIGRTVLLCALAAALAAVAGTGWRAQQRLQQQLDPALEGRDLQLTGRIARMPQRSDVGWRFRFEVHEARLDGAVVPVPPHVQLGWYASSRWGAEADAAPGPALPMLRAGDRWQLTARLKRPHGNLNPHGFDVEL